MRSGVFAVVGSKHNHCVLPDVCRQAIQCVQHAPNLCVDYLHHLRVTIEAALPVAERHLGNTIVYWQPRARIPPDGGRTLRWIVGNTAPNALAEFPVEGLAGWLILCNGP